MTDANLKTWYMVPVRGGSVGVPRKNAKLLGGKPLLCHVLSTIQEVDSAEQIIVVTDDDELKTIALNEGVRVVMEPKTTGKATLDDVCMGVLPDLEKFGASDDDVFLTVQATCPFVEADTIRKAKSILAEKKGCIITVMDDRHLNWTVDDEGNPEPLYTERVNRQQLPANFRESGAVIGSIIKTIKENKTRINKPINILEISQKEGHDIDDFKDWMVAEYFAGAEKYIIRADASKKMGMGHAYRALTLASELGRYRPSIVTCHRDGDTLGEEFFRQYPYPLSVVESDDAFLELVQKEKPDFVFLDQLSTSKEYVQAIKECGAKVVSFEDLGEGAQEADLVINDLYKISGLSEEKQFFGVKNVFLPSSFQGMAPQEKTSKTVENILVLFGGTDPLNLTKRSLEALQAIKYKGRVTVIKGLGQKDRPLKLEDYGLQGEILENVDYIAKVMKSADMALSSAGRTITELMYFGVPTMCICQNERELTHSHASQLYGVHNVGLGSLADDATIQNNLQFLIDNPQFRQKMQTRALEAMRGHSNGRVMKRIMTHLESLD